MDTKELITHVAANFSRIYLGGIPSLLNDDGAFLSFICALTAIEALGGFLCPKAGNGPRFKTFVERYFPAPYPAESDSLWKLRNAAVHGFSPGPYSLTHHKSHVHLTQSSGRTVLNAEDFYATLLSASKRYFDDLGKDATLQAAFLERTKDPDTGVLVVGQASVAPYLGDRVTSGDNMNVGGLILNFIGVVMLLVYSERTEGGTTPADRDYLASPWWYRLGYGLLSLGFLLQVVAASLR